MTTKMYETYAALWLMSVMSWMATALLLVYLPAAAVNVVCDNLCDQ
jgi:uncharacterized membrane protein